MVSFLALASYSQDTGRKAGGVKVPGSSRGPVHVRCRASDGAGALMRRSCTADNGLCASSSLKNFIEMVQGRNAAAFATGGGGILLFLLIVLGARPLLFLHETPPCDGSGMSLSAVVHMWSQQNEKVGDTWMRTDSAPEVERTGLERPGEKEVMVTWEGLWRGWGAGVREWRVGEKGREGDRREGRDFCMICLAVSLPLGAWTSHMQMTLMPHAPLQTLRALASVSSTFAQLFC